VPSMGDELKTLKVKCVKEGWKCAKQYFSPQRFGLRQVRCKRSRRGSRRLHVRGRKRLRYFTQQKRKKRSPFRWALLST
jgi:hypothetical protein